jgi:hypothetical protein
MRAVGWPRFVLKEIGTTLALSSGGIRAQETSATQSGANGKPIPVRVEKPIAAST